MSYDTKWDWDDEDIPGDLVRIDTTYAEIFVEGNGETTIRFKEEKELAENGSLAEDIDFGTAEKMLARLSELYINLIGGKDVQYDIRHDRMFDGSPIRSYSVFPVTEDARTTYLNASFATVTFGPGGSGGLGSLQIKNGLHAAERIGDYPLISEEEATKRLLDGCYLTSVPSEYLADGEVTEEAILSCELTYHNTQADTHFITYYHYYVRLDEFSDNGSAEDLVTYGGYWVPAVHPDYLDPDTVWDGRFN